MTAPHDFIFLSPPHVGGTEREMLIQAFDSNWIAPAGPDLLAFEEEFADAVGVRHAVGVSSGTAALHLALMVLGVGRGDDVIVSDLTFAASANAVTYVGAQPVFVDAARDTWNMDPDLLAGELHRRAARGKLPAAVIVVDLYGQCADYDRIVPLCHEFGVPVIEDAAEALGASYRGRPAGALADIAAFSFNGNKIITTSGGGMLVSDRREWVDRARHLATQAREPVAHYEHLDIGFNYRLSNLLAALGRAQLRGLPERVAARRRIAHRYRTALSSVDGVDFMPDAPYGTPTNWLTVATFDACRLGVQPEQLRTRLLDAAIEARPAWKPMHLQPAYAHAPVVGGRVGEAIFATGLCLPSGSCLSDAQQDRVIEALLNALDDAGRHRSTAAMTLDG